MLIFLEGGKPENRGKTLVARVRINNKLNSLALKPWICKCVMHGQSLQWILINGLPSMRGNAITDNIRVSLT
jgi:hypothetical protein